MGFLRDQGAFSYERSQMKKLKRTFAAVLAAIMTLGTVTSAYASTAIVKYKEFVYTDEITFYGYDYEDSMYIPTVFLNALICLKKTVGFAHLFENVEINE